MKQIGFFFLFISAIAGLISCKQKAIMVNPGAVVSREGEGSDAENATDDGLKNVKNGANGANGGLKNVKTGMDNPVRTHEGTQFTFSSDLLFPTNSSYLTDEAKEELGKLASALKADLSKKIRVDGHTDSTGEARYNQWLSEKRAASVEKFLADAGVSPSRIVTKGLGQTKPIADNKTPEGRQRNRRVEVTVLD